jgi:hypothetical protein
MKEGPGTTLSQSQSQPERLRPSQGAIRVSPKTNLSLHKNYSRIPTWTGKRISSKQCFSYIQNTMHILQAIRVKYKYTNKSLVVILFRWSLWTHIQTHIHPNTHTHTYPLSPSSQAHVWRYVLISNPLSPQTGKGRVLHAVCMLFAYSVDSGDPHFARNKISKMHISWRLRVNISEPESLNV